MLSAILNTMQNYHLKYSMYYAKYHIGKNIHSLQKVTYFDK
jgi:hypothetical protein